MLRAGSRSTVYPSELTAKLGDFVEHDLDDAFERPAGDEPKPHGVDDAEEAVTADEEREELEYSANDVRNMVEVLHSS